MRIGKEEEARTKSISAERGGLLRRAKELHDDQAMHCERPLKDFHRFCASWRHQLWAAENEAGEMVGYLVADKEGTFVPELMARSPDEALRMVRAWITEGGKEGVSLDMSPVNNVSRDLARYCEQTSVRPSGNWQVLRWAEVVDALMKVQQQSKAGLVEGKVVVGIEGYGAIALVVTDGEAVIFTCQRFESVTGQVIYALSLLGGGGERIAHDTGASRCVPPALGELGKGQGSTKGGGERFIPKGSRHVDEVRPQM